MNNTHTQNVKEAPVQPLYSHILRLNDLHDTQGKSWRFIAQNVTPYIGICHATLRRIAKGHAPKEAEVRAKLELDTKKQKARPRWVRILGHAGGSWQ